MQRRSEIINLAKQTRFYLELLALHNETDLAKKDLCGYCGVGSFFLKRLGSFLDFDLDFVCGTYNSKNYYSGHCWVEYDNYIIDITGSQFFLDIINPIHIVRRNHKYKSKRTNSNAINYMNNYWPIEQRYSTYEKDLENIVLIAGEKLKAIG